MSCVEGAFGVHSDSAGCILCALRVHLRSINERLRCTPGAVTVHSGCVGRLVIE